MSHDEFDAAGRALYGEQWKGSLAAALGVSTSAVRRWAKKPERVPPAVVDAITALLAVRQKSFEARKA